ncbi:hypothetical protein CPB85DRAFT_1262376 [Mucidula mucida]|nr:hypothetical protein CPB85DRAFT_1262376 [Mucidula mucida]
MSPQPGFGVQLPNLHFCRICVYDTFNNAYDLEGRRTRDAFPPKHISTTEQQVHPVLDALRRLIVCIVLVCRERRMPWHQVRRGAWTSKRSGLRIRRRNRRSSEEEGSWSYCLTAKYVVKLKVEHPGSEYAEGILVRPREEGTCWYKISEKKADHFDSERTSGAKFAEFNDTRFQASKGRNRATKENEHDGWKEETTLIGLRRYWDKEFEPAKTIGGGTSRDSMNAILQRPRRTGFFLGRKLISISRCSAAFWYTTRFNSFGMYMRICRLRESWQSVNILRPADLERSDTTSAIALAGQAFGLGRRQVRRSLGLNTPPSRPSNWACTRAVSLRIADPDLDLTTFRVAVVFGPCYGELGPGPFAERGTQQRRRDRLVTVWTLPLESVDNWNKGTPHFDFDDMPVHGDGVNGAPSAIQSLLKPKTFALAKARDIPKIAFPSDCFAGSRGGDGAGASLSPRLTPSAIYSTTKGKQTYSGLQPLSSTRTSHSNADLDLWAFGLLHELGDFADWANGNLFKPDNDGHYLKAPTALTTAQQDEYSDLGGTLRHILILGPAELWEEVGSGVLKRPPRRLYAHAHLQDPPTNLESIWSRLRRLRLRPVAL